LIYLLGLFFLAYCNLLNDLNVIKLTDETFITLYNFNTHSPTEAAIKVTYFAITSLATVGFGDLNPRNDYERIMVSIMLLTGVALFSFIMGNFIAILNSFKSINDEPEESQELSKFLQVLQRFNMNKPLSYKQHFEDYFEFRWQNNKNYAFESDEDKAIFEQLPSKTKISLYVNYLYLDFTRSFRKYFSFYKPSRYRYSRFTWADKYYEEFMLEIYKFLMPIHMNAGFLIIGELEDVGRVNFITQGEVKVGFEVNKHEYFRFLLQSDPVNHSFNSGKFVGAFECLNNQRSTFVYRAKTNVKGFFIKKLNMNTLVYNFPDLMSVFKQKITIDYIKMLSWLNF
jgi:hypothetical protein